MIVDTTEQSRRATRQAESVSVLRMRADSLFPPDAIGRIGRRRITLSVTFVALMTVVSLVRQNGPGALDSIWAEDGLTFYQATFHQDAFHALFTANNGYLQLLPRLVVPLIALFPIAWAAALLSIVGALISSACALLVYHASAALIPSRVARLCFAVPTAVLMYGQSDVGNDVVNAQWYLIYTAFWMMLWNPRTRARRVLAGIVVFLAIGSDPLASMFAPLVALRLWSRPWRESAWQFGGVVAGVLLQGVAIIRGSLSTRPPTHDYSLPFALDGYARYVTGTTLASTRELGDIGLPRTIEAQVIGILAVLVIAVAALLWNRAANRLLALVCAAFSLLFFCLTTMQDGFYAARYAVPPALLLLTALAVLCAPTRAASGHVGETAKRWVTARWAMRTSVPLAVLCVLIGANLAANYYGGSKAREISPSWSSQVDRARAGCRVPGTMSARLQTAPGGGWSVTAPCSRLAS